MTDKVQRTVEQSMQDVMGIDPSAINPEMGSRNVFSWMVDAGDILPPWWSRQRDLRLWDMVVQSNHLSIATYNATVKMTGIPFRIIARDPNIPQHNEQAEELDTMYKLTPGFGAGWEVEWSKFILSLLTTDNGAFMEVIGAGEPDGPIMGLPVSVRHLDSRRCQRTSNPEFPVIYMDDDGRRYKMHWTRVISMSQMPSDKKEMNGVGLCAVSRCFLIGRTLNDMVLYKQERLGSRPHNQVLVGAGITGEEIATAFRMVEDKLNDSGLRRYSKTVAIGSKNTDIKLDKIDLTHMDPFDESTSTNLGMYAIAAAFGLEAEELWPAGGSGGGQGDADLRRMRSRSRLPAVTTGEFAKQFSYKVLPPHLKFEFDFQDDAQDQARAVIRDIRSRNRERDLGTGALDNRTARLRMMSDGDITRESFEEIELRDGRLPDGKPISYLFYDRDPIYQRTLRFSKDPLAIKINDPQEMIKEIQQRRSDLMILWSASSSSSFQDRYSRAAHALNWIEDEYKFAAGELLPAVPQHLRRWRTDQRLNDPSETRANEELAEQNEADGGREVQMTQEKDA